MKMSSGCSLSAVGKIRAALKDTLLVCPCTSERVERFHANLQASQNTAQNSGRIASVVQQESYVTLARIHHNKMRVEVEKSVMGSSSFRAKRLMRERRVQGAGDDTSMRSKVRKTHFNKSKRKTPKTSTWNAFLSQRTSVVGQSNVELAAEYRHMMATDDGRRTLRCRAAAIEAAKRQALVQTLGPLSTLAM